MDSIPSEVDHIGADIAFAPDGTLFVSTGDGGGEEHVEPTAFRAQSIDALGGKVLHVTRDGAGLESNPFYAGDTDANRSKVWAYGLRNPFRLTVSANGALPVVGDVGWDHAEELDTAPAGANLGWPCLEGRDRTEQYESTSRCTSFYDHGPPRHPIVVYLHPSAESVTGGLFYRANAYPARYRNVYFFADWLRGWLRYARIDATGGLVGGPDDFGTGFAGPVAMRVGRDGLLCPLGQQRSSYSHRLRRVSRHRERRGWDSNPRGACTPNVVRTGPLATRSGLVSCPP